MLKNIMTQLVNSKINIPTPVMAGVRTPIRQYACVLVDVDDTLPSIFRPDMPWALCCPKSRIGINAEGSEVSTHGLEAVRYNIRVLFLSLRNLKRLLNVVRRMESEEDRATVHFPIWHQEIEDILVLKNNKEVLKIIELEN